MGYEPMRTKHIINSSLDVDQYPLPKPDDSFATLAGGKKAGSLPSIPTICRWGIKGVSNWGLYQYTRLPFGVASAPDVSEVHGYHFTGYSTSFVTLMTQEKLMQNTSRILQLFYDYSNMAYAWSYQRVHEANSGLPGTSYWCGRIAHNFGKAESYCWGTHS